MRENGIDSITIQNFKAFQTEITIPVNRKHVLIYGPNGSGKSSLYWALYTLFQCATKPLETIEKYFQIANDENLLNVNEPNLSSYIKIKTIANGTERDFKLDISGVDGEKANLKELDLASDFISHRLLINFYNFHNSKEINLKEVFERDILPFIQGHTHFKDRVLLDVLKDINDQLISLVGRQWRKVQSIEENELKNINIEVKSIVDFINLNATKYLEDYFKPNDIKINITYRGAYQVERRIVGRKKKFFLIPPFFKLTIESKKADGTWQNIDRPQSFLNEARLTRIGVAIRFCLLQRRIQNVPLKILALDDMLISLDLDNRLQLIETILNLYKNEYQLFIFTHEKGFYNEIKRHIINEVEDWNIYEFLDQDKQQIRFKNAKTNIEKATDFLKDGEYENCALELRRLGEIILKNFILEHESKFFKAKEYISFSQMIEETKNIICQRSIRIFQEKILGQDISEEEWELVKSEEFKLFRENVNVNVDVKSKVATVRKTIFESAQFMTNELQGALKAVNQIKILKDRLLNYGAHPSDDVLYKTEMEEALELFKGMQGILNKV